MLERFHARKAGRPGSGRSGIPELSAVVLLSVPSFPQNYLLLFLSHNSESRFSTKVKLKSNLNF